MRIFPRKGCVLLLLLSSIATLESRLPTFNQVVDLVLQCRPSMGHRPPSQRLVNARARQAGSSLNAHPQPQSQTDGIERLSLVSLANFQPIGLGHKKARRIQGAEAPRQDVSDRKLLLVMLAILGIGLNGCCQFLWTSLDILSDLALSLLEAFTEWDSILVAEVDSASKLPANKTWDGVDGGLIPIFGAVTTLKLSLGLRVIGPVLVLGLIVACRLDRERYQ